MVTIKPRAKLLMIKVDLHNAQALVKMEGGGTDAALSMV